MRNTDMSFDRPMGTPWLAVLGCFFIFQASVLNAVEEATCEPGFESNLLIFRVTRNPLRQGTRLGKVGFTDCTNRRRFLFSTDDGHFLVQTDGTLTVKRQVVLHEGHRNFFIHSWNSQGHKLTVAVNVLHHDGHHHGNHLQNAEHHRSKVDSSNDTEAGTEHLPVIHFPKSSEGLRRRKRDWVIPPISIQENARGNFPQKISQIRSDKAGKKKIYYSIIGVEAEGVKAPREGLFTIDKDYGTLYVTQPLDREIQKVYMLKAHATAEGSGTAEEPMDIIVKVFDQNDNPPVFDQSTYLGEVAEALPVGHNVILVKATDLDGKYYNATTKDDDEPLNLNFIIRYSIVSQDPKEPSGEMFAINPVTGRIRLNAVGLDKEIIPQYTLVVRAADGEGQWLSTEAKVLLKVTDSNDNPPIFSQRAYEATVAENKPDTFVIKMLVTDKDEANSPAWNAKFKIVDGDPGNFFSVETGPNKQEGILKTVKGLDFERSSRHTLLITVENEVPFVIALPTSTATVVVTVQDVNEPPIFDPKVKHVSKPEDLAVDSEVVLYTARDPDIARNQKVMYRIIKDPAGWLSVDADTGRITVKSTMDRESPLVKKDRYEAVITAYDNDSPSATGTGTLIIQLQDVNDDPPSIVERQFEVCNKKPAPQFLSVMDKDGPGFTSPYGVSLRSRTKSNWTASMNSNKTAIKLGLAVTLEPGEYNVVLRVSDVGGLEQDSTIHATVCDCTGEKVQCGEPKKATAGLPTILSILGGVLLLLMLLLVLLLIARRRRTEKKEPLLLAVDDIRDDIYCYDEQGGGEDDQEFDLSILHRGLDNRPEVFRNDVIPSFMPAPQYRPQPTNPGEIGNFINDNLKAADNDPTAPPFDCLLVFDYEGGGGSDAGSLSSLNSASSGDQDYDCLSGWGPRFKKLADMFGGGEDDDML